MKPFDFHSFNANESRKTSPPQHMRLLICRRTRACELEAGGGAAPHIGMVIRQSAEWHVQREKGERRASDRDISFTKHFLLCTWKRGIIMGEGDAPWNGMGAKIWGSGHSAVSTEIRVILYSEMPVSGGNALQVRVRQSHRQPHHTIAHQIFHLSGVEISCLYSTKWHKEYVTASK